MHWMNWFGDGGIMMLVWGGFVIVGTALVVKWLSDQRSRIKNEESPLEILEKRNANGEIDKEEFQEKKKDLV
jgi:putative membrane protein